ncbi:MAG TPA: DUF1292 domain-containing protein [Lachnospiraceae bacterium]|uniref:DUF1292 domain-containing protein n=1 Tax=Anaerosporobacter sp. TaxID=1872529 RepID=UPI000EC2721B|nr:DUF1292 domain-containing protein [Anaerosporobacter sp.]HAB60654.1 DUF1292 domain-containing protein [Lachnospiraceae bacterium]
MEEKQDKQEKIVFTTQDNEKIEFYVLEQTMINGVNYILVADSIEDEEANALILKESANEADEIIYDVVEDDNELQAISKVFIEMLDDTDIELEKE